jgi:hypothetical protein
MFGAIETTTRRWRERRGRPSGRVLRLRSFVADEIDPGDLLTARVRLDRRERQRFDVARHRTGGHPEPVELPGMDLRVAGRRPRDRVDGLGDRAAFSLDRRVQCARRRLDVPSRLGLHRDEGDRILLGHLHPEHHRAGVVTLVGDRAESFGLRRRCGSRSSVGTPSNLGERMRERADEGNRTPDSAWEAGRPQHRSVPSNCIFPARGGKTAFARSPPNTAGHRCLRPF